MNGEKESGGNGRSILLYHHLFAIVFELKACFVLRKLFCFRAGGSCQLDQRPARSRKAVNLIKVPS